MNKYVNITIQCCKNSFKRKLKIPQVKPWPALILKHSYPLQGNQMLKWKLCCRIHGNPYHINRCHGNLIGLHRSRKPLFHDSNQVSWQYFVERAGLHWSYFNQSYRFHSLWTNKLNNVLDFYIHLSLLI